MRIQDMGSSGPAIDLKRDLLHTKVGSTTLPFGMQIPLSSVAGPSYVTAQTLVQQVAYVLSDRIFSYSPDSFDLDIAAREWAAGRERNASGTSTPIHQLQTRGGAGSVALGYMFSKDFDVKKRHIPQGLLATSSALPYLRTALDQLSLLYAVSNPLVAHIAAVDYDGSKGGQLVTDYVSAMRTADDLGFALVASQSAYESQHMALLSTLLSQTMPVLHVYDGLGTSRDTVRVIDALDTAGLSQSYQTALKATGEAQKHLTTDGKILQTLNALNEELGTDYKCFEYHGHESADLVLVTFGSIESSVAAQVVTAAAHSGKRIGAINVRVYRPFVEDEFVKSLPDSTTKVAVLGQVSNALELAEGGIHSQLYEDVLAALTFAKRTQDMPAVSEIKYPRSENWTPERMCQVLEQVLGCVGEVSIQSHLSGNDLQQYSFWMLDQSASSSAPSLLAQALATDSSQNVTVSTTQDNLVQGGAVRVDIRKSPKSLETPYPVTAADVAVVGDVKLLEEVDVLSSVKSSGKVLLLLPGVKDEDVEKKLPPTFRKALSARAIELYLIDATNTTETADRPDIESIVLQTAFLRVALPKSEEVGMQKLATVSSDMHTLEKVSADLDKTLRHVEIPKEWSEVEVEKTDKALPSTLTRNSFATFDKTEEEPPSLLRNWQKAAKGLLFKEAYGTKPSLRPDLPQKTFTVHVKENRRLTPLTYDRHIFHIEFDLGTSGLKYNIGEALGIHAENDYDQIMEFIKWYDLDPQEVVEVASRDDSGVFENRTVYQSLMQNVDIFGRPPKKFYESLAEFATDAQEQKDLLTLAGPDGFKEFQRRAEVDTITFADVLLEFPSAHPSFHELVRIVAPMKRREYSIASCQAVTPTSVALMVVVVNWTDPRGRDRFGQATRYLAKLPLGSPVTVSVKPSVMKLPSKSTQPLIMAGLGTGLAPFRAFVQHRAMEKAQGKPVGDVLLYMGSRHQREEYCYGEEWEAYQAAGVITLLGRAFSRDQPRKIYIQDRMRQTIDSIIKAYIKEDGAFYLCGPTWPVPDVTAVLEEAIERNTRQSGLPVKKGTGSRKIMELKDDRRYVLEVY